ncbi:MAG: sulfatase-like hydrolase/transferase [Chitinophagaceae bacterium]
MAAKFKFILIYFFSWVIFFDLMRVVFLLYHFGKTKQLPFRTILGSLCYGLKMDMSVAAYVTAPVCLFVLLSLWIRFFKRLPVYRIYTVIVLLIVCVICLADLEIYSSWGVRLDMTPLRFVVTPKEAYASISHIPLVFVGLIFVAAYALFYFCFVYILKRLFFQEQNKHKPHTAVALLLFTGALIIPIRGGLQQTPMNQSSVYFSTHNYANQAAINPVWNLLRSAMSKAASSHNPYLYLSEETVKKVTDSLYQQGPLTESVLHSSDSAINVLVVVWESFTEKALHVSIRDQQVTPRFNQLRKEGIYFNNMYASGDRTYKGLPAIFSGYPAMPNGTIIHSPAKSIKLQVLAHLFSEKGYTTPFFYGGEPEFANIKSYLLQGGFNPIIGKSDFDAKDMNSKWGAHDGVVMKRVLNDLDKEKQPFFAAWLTLTSHEPFETPVPVVFPGMDTKAKFMNSLHYTDAVIGEFIDSCKTQPWWKNTLVIITGDHGHILPDSDHRADDFRTPMLWLGGALNRDGVVIEKNVSQLDIAATISAQFGLDRTKFPFSKNVFDPAVKPWAFFTYNDAFGFVDSTGRLVFDNIGKRPIEREGTTGAKQIEAGKAMMQWVYDDFLKK